MLKKFWRKILAVTAAVSAMALTAVQSFAATGDTGLATYADDITAQFKGAATDIMPIIIGVLGVGLGIFAVFKGIKLAKKMFGTVSNG